MTQKRFNRVLSKHRGGAADVEHSGLGFEKVTLLKLFGWVPVAQRQSNLAFLATARGVRRSSWPLNLETSPEDVVLFCKAYPGLVCDVRSFYEWCRQRAAIVFSSSLVHAFLLTHDCVTLATSCETPSAFSHESHSTPCASAVLYDIFHQFHTSSLDHC